MFPSPKEGTKKRKSNFWDPKMVLQRPTMAERRPEHLLLIAGLVLIGGNTMVVFCCQKLAVHWLGRFHSFVNRIGGLQWMGGWLTRFLRFICGNLSAAIDKSSVDWKRGLHSTQYFLCGPAHGVTSFLGALSSHSVASSHVHWRNYQVKSVRITSSVHPFN